MRIVIRIARHHRHIHILTLPSAPIRSVPPLVPCPCLPRDTIPLRTTSPKRRAMLILCPCTSKRIPQISVSTQCMVVLTDMVVSSVDHTHPNPSRFPRYPPLPPTQRIRSTRIYPIVASVLCPCRRSPRATRSDKTTILCCTISTRKREVRTCTIRSCMYIVTMRAMRMHMERGTVTT